MANIEPNKNTYKHLAPNYDKLTNLSVFNVYLSIIGKIKNKSLLDLGCGTGTLLKEYSNTNETYGVDGSLNMIKVAKAKDKKSIYKIGDIRKIKLNKKFDIITCAFDTINHLLTLAGWECLFKNVAKHLNDDGVFIFDYNTVASLGKGGGAVFKKIKNDFVARRVIKVGRLCFWEFHTFKKQPSGLFKYEKSVIKEASFPNKIVEAKVKKYFKIIDVIKDGEYRVYIKAIKKAI